MSRESPSRPHRPEFPFSLITTARQTHPKPTIDSLLFSPPLPVPVPVPSVPISESPDRRRLSDQQAQELPSTREGEGEELTEEEDEQQQHHQQRRQQQEEVDNTPSEGGESTETRQPRPPPLPRRRQHLRRLRTRVRKMGNHLTAAFGCCVSDSSLGLCKDGSSSDGSPTLRTWCYNSEYPPEFIRSVIENNVLFGHLSME